MKIPQISSTDQLIPTRSGEINRFLQALRLGNVLDAEVLQRLDDHRVEVRVGDRVLTASHPGSLNKGTVFRVQVVSPWPEVVLKIVAFGSEQDGVLQKILWKALPFMGGDAAKRIWTEAFEVLQRLRWEGFTGKDDGGSFLLRHSLRPGSWNLLAYLKASGLLLESKLAGRVKGFDPTNGPEPDLKALILRVLHSHSGRGDGRQSISPLLDLIQGSQSLSVLTKDGATHLYLPLLLWGFQRGDWGDLTIHGEGSNRRGRGRSWTVTVRLDLSSLGRLLVHLTLKFGVLNCSIQASNPSTRLEIQSGLQELQKRLSALGFRGVSCQCGSLENPEEDFHGPVAVPEGLLEMRV